jgi:hypothetical protein
VLLISLSRARRTEDATVIALNKEMLTQEVAQQQHTWENWLWSNTATIVSSFLIKSWKIAKLNESDGTRNKNAG